MRKPNKVKLTQERIRQIKPPEKGEVTIWDTEAPGLGVRCLPSGMMTYTVAYRAGYGRAGTPRRMTIGKVDRTELSIARELAMEIRRTVLHGGDPVADRRAEARAVKYSEMKISNALTRYASDLKTRNVVDRRNVESILRRLLIGHVGDIPLTELSRRAIVEAVEQLESEDKLGAAKALRSYTSTFLKWCADRGLMEVNPLLGYRAPRSTRAQRIAQPGRELPDNELALAWVACGSETINRAYGQLIRVMILTGQRRTETSRMRWADVDRESAIWKIPAKETKNGIAHEVPLPPLALSVINAAPEFADCDWVFSTNGRIPMSGWSKLDKKLRAQVDALAGETGIELPHWTLHDLRRTYRSGLTRLKVDPDVAEIMLNHRPATLRSIYDRDPQMDGRWDAAKRWANHVGAIIDPDGQANVVKMRETK